MSSCGDLAGPSPQRGCSLSRIGHVEASGAPRRGGTPNDRRRGAPCDRCIVHASSRRTSTSSRSMHDARVDRCRLHASSRRARVACMVHASTRCCSARRARRARRAVTSEGARVEVVLVLALVGVGAAEAGRRLRHELGEVGAGVEGSSGRGLGAPPGRGRQRVGEGGVRGTGHPAPARRSAGRIGTVQASSVRACRSGRARVPRRLGGDTT